MIEGNYQKALLLIPETNQRENMWVTRDLIEQVFKSIGKQVDMTNKNILVEIFAKVTKGEGFEELISDKLSNIYYSGIQVQIDIIIGCIERMIINRDYDALMFNIIFYSLKESNFRFCRFIFDIYKEL